ncbi:2'-O-methyl transferase [Listeria marthii]|uniref:2'-O-methyl transferase n=2 Tax=Listeria TaxID=1637 RepID=A0A7X1DAK3_9LIST|nr:MULTISPECIES: 2'-O-methyl transferase [Listeria]MBC1977489.1 2'-O-methyl transferase [Listeria marthii]MBC1998882.1 2'-O-methyl transferase [Listeria marthii]MBC2039760.1 2'-O-methyl transferase [Listeria marthii]MBC2063037.1 2'-O-methyl transferase [Listeria marthii]MBC2074668.1 2'-O-methyl transferase [Listeria marthii]
MKKYTINRIIITLLLMIYVVSILAIIKGEKPFETTNFLEFMLIGVIVVSLTVFGSKNTIKKQFEEDKVEKDERYLKNRNIFSYYFVISLGVFIPIILGFASIIDVKQLSLSNIATIFLIISIVYLVAIEVIRRKL